MNHVVERPTSLLKPALPGNKPYIESRKPKDRKPVTASFNRKVKLFEHMPEDANNEDDLSPLRRRQPKAVTPDQKRWTQIESTDNSTIWLSQPNVPPRIGGSCKQKTLPPTPSPRLLSPASPSRLTPTTFTPKEEKESDVKKTPKPKPRARTSIRSSGYILDSDTSEGTTSQLPPPSQQHLAPSPVPSPRKSLGLTEVCSQFTEALNQFSQTPPTTYKPPPTTTYKPPSPTTFKPPPTIPQRRDNKEANRRSPPVYFEPPAYLHHTRDKDFSGGTSRSSTSPQVQSSTSPRVQSSTSPRQSQPPAVPNHKNLKNSHEKLNNHTSLAHRTLPNQRTRPESSVHVDNQSIMAFNRDFRAQQRKQKTRTQFDNVTYDSHIPAKDDNERRPRASTDLVNGRANVDEEDDKRISVFEIAQAFGKMGKLNKKELYGERPKMRGSAMRNGHPNKIKLAQSNPDLLSDDSEGVPVRNDGYSGKIARSNPDLLSDDSISEEASGRNGGRSDTVTSSNPDLLSDDCAEQEESRSKSHKQEVQLGKLERRRSKSLSDFDPIDMPPMDPAKYTHGGKVKQTKPLRPQKGPMRPISMLPGPAKPKRTYEHDEYVLRKSMKGLPRSGGHAGVAQTRSAAPTVGRIIAPITIPPSINAKKKHTYDDVAIERQEVEKEEVQSPGRYYQLSPSQSLPSPPWAKPSHRLLSPPEEESTTSPKQRPHSSMSAITKSPKPRRGKLQRSARIERSHSHEDLLSTDDPKISGEYANPEIALMSKNKREKSSRRKPEYSEPYLQRSSSEDSLQNNRRTHPPVEDSEGYTVPGSHLWDKIPEEKNDQDSQVKVAVHNASGEKLIADIAEEGSMNFSSSNSTGAGKSYGSKRFPSRRKKQQVHIIHPRDNAKEEKKEVAIAPTTFTYHGRPRKSEGDIGILGFNRIQRNKELSPPSQSFISRRVRASEPDISLHGFRQRSQNVRMRQKIQNAFSRQRGNKVDEDTLSVTSEDSDLDLNDSVLKKRLTHVRAVKRRTSAYCSLEWYRKTMQYNKLFEYVVIVSLKFNKETRRHEPCEIRRFPHEISDSQNDKLRAIPLFCFPDAFKWAKVEEYNSESYSFVLTSIDGSRLYGYNRRLLPPGDGPRLPEVYCVMSPIGCPTVYNELLDEIEKRRQVSMQAVEVLLKTARDNPFPRPGERLRIKMPSQPITKPLVLHRPTDSRLEQMNFSCLFDSLDVAKVIQVFASLLLERRVVMCSSKLSKLSSCSQAIAALLYPFAWQHVYVPVLPEKLIDMCCSPTPYIMGMLSLCIPKLDEMPGIDEVIVVDLDSKDFYFLVGDEETILPKKLYVGLQRALSFVENGSAENIDDNAQMDDPDSMSNMISEAFIHFFVETVGHYSNHFHQQYDGTLKFDRDGFLNAVRSRSTRRFLEVFTETQMFSLFIQEKETESEGICQGIFERRVKAFEREKANNATFSTKMKKIVKESGLRFALPGRGRARLKTK